MFTYILTNKKDDFMNEISNEELEKMVSSAVKEAIAPIEEQFRQLGESKQGKTETKEEKPKDEVSDAVKQYIADKKADLFSGKPLENRTTSFSEKQTENSVLTGKSI